MSIYIRVDINTLASEKQYESHYECYILKEEQARRMETIAKVIHKNQVEYSLANNSMPRVYGA